MLQKKEDTWCRTLTYFRYGIRYSPEIGEESSMGSGTEGVLHIRNSDGNLYVRCLNWNGNRWNWNYNWLDNNFNCNNPAACSQLSSFLPFQGVFF